MNAVWAALTPSTEPQTIPVQTESIPLDYLVPPLQWLLDPKGNLPLQSVLPTDQLPSFQPYTETSYPKQAGTIWIRIPLAESLNANPTLAQRALLLDLNMRIAGQLPGIPRLWIVDKDGTQATSIQPDQPGLYTLLHPLPEGAVLMLRTTGLPGAGFAPIVRPANSLHTIDTLALNVLLGILVAGLLLSLLRGIVERREWRMWAALYMTATLTQAFWGLPSTPNGEVSIWDIPGLLAPALALLILPHVGRHFMKTRERAHHIDLQLMLLAVPSSLLAVAPLLPGYAWTTRFFPFWSLGALLLLPTMLYACLKKVIGAKRFTLLIILPPLGLLAFIPLHRPHTAETLFFETLLSFLPLATLALSVLLMTLLPTPRFPDLRRKDTWQKRNARSNEGSRTDRARRTAHSALDLSPQEPALSLDDDPGLHLIDEPPTPFREERPTAPATIREPQRTAKMPHALQVAVPLGIVEEALREPLDALLRAISALDQSPLSKDARNHVDTLNHLGRRLMLLSSHLPRAKDVPPSETPHPGEPFNLNQLLRGIHDGVQEQADQKNLSLSWFTAPHLPRRFEGPRAQLTEVLHLLVESAVLATDRGMVQIRAQRMPESTDPGHILFTVSDSGRSAPPYGRTTLPLVRAWELVGMTGGSLSLESSPTGTTVSLSLSLIPLLAEQRPSIELPEAVEETLTQLPVSPLRIIVTSSISSNRQLMAYYLDELPHEVVETRNAEEALALYQRMPGALIIFDDDIAENDIAHTVAAVRAFENEHCFPLASILALVHDEARGERLRRAGCTHTLLHPVVRAELRHLALRLAPVPRKNQPTVPEPAIAQRDNRLAKAPQEQPLSFKGTPQTLPRPEANAAPVREAQNRAFEKRDTLEKVADRPLAQRVRTALTALFASKTVTKPHAPDTTLLTSSAPHTLSHVGEPMPIPRPPKTEGKEHASSRADHFHTASPRTTPAPVTPDTSVSDNAHEWVGEPTPIVRTTPVSEPQAKATTAPEKPAERVSKPLSAPAAENTVTTPVAPTAPAAPTAVDTLPKEKMFSAPQEALEWVGEPTPIVRKTPAVQETSSPGEPLTPQALATSSSDKPLDVLPAASSAVSEHPQSVSVKSPRPKVDTHTLPTLDLTPSASKEVGHGSGALTLTEPALSENDTPDQAEAIITLTETLPEESQPASPLPDLFGSDMGTSFLRHEGTVTHRDTASTLTLNLDNDCSESSTSSEASLAEENTLSEPLVDNTDIAIQHLLKTLDLSLKQALQAQQTASFAELERVAQRIGSLAQTMDLRVLEDSARCLELAAQAKDSDDIEQIMIDLSAAVHKNRESFTASANHMDDEEDGMAPAC